MFIFSRAITPDGAILSSKHISTRSICIGRLLVTLPPCDRIFDTPLKIDGYVRGGNNPTTAYNIKRKLLSG